ncbi:MAG: VCBS repeat-containing protein [Acidobacteriales bacterium]|nr:VCBS repeat-containing protein [Terriglobales bacterium]
MVRWNGAPRPTSFVNSSQLTANIRSSDVAFSATASVTVSNPSGGMSNAVNFPITNPISSVSFRVSSLATTGHSSGITVGDFNSDGKQDIAVLDGFDKLMSVLLSVGDGTFLPHVDYPELGSSSGTTSLTSGDVNGDGKLDLITVGSVLLGNGDGTFQSPLAYSGTPDAQAVQAADVNGDGKLDVVTANFSSTISVLLGNGNGTFQPAMVFGSDLYSVDLTIGDFNGDGKLDVATAGSEGTGYVYVLLGNGDGTFQDPQRLHVGSVSAFGIASADFNHDGILDLVVTDDSDFPSTTELAFFQGKGDGTFKKEQLTDVSDFTCGYDMNVADLNGDGNLDVVVGLNFSPSAFLLGNGDGTFQSPGKVSGGTLTAVGSFNGDGRLDVAVAGKSAVTLSLQPVAAATLVNVTSSENPSHLGDTVTFTATVTSTNNGATPTGFVAFRTASMKLGSAALVNGKASISTSSLPLGHHSITAIYSGDSTYPQNKSQALIQTVD